MMMITVYVLASSTVELMTMSCLLKQPSIQCTKFVMWNGSTEGVMNLLLLLRLLHIRPQTYVLFVMMENTIVRKGKSNVTVNVVW